MLVRFISSETGELMMFAEVAHQILAAMGKPCTAKGAFLADEMPTAAAALRAAVARGEAVAEGEEDDEKPVALGRRAWPFIEMLEKTAAAGERANIVWEAPRDF